MAMVGNGSYENDGNDGNDDKDGNDENDDNFDNFDKTMKWRWGDDGDSDDTMAVKGIRVIMHNHDCMVSYSASHLMTGTHRKGTASACCASYARPCAPPAGPPPHPATCTSCHHDCSTTFIATIAIVITFIATIRSSFQLSPLISSTLSSSSSPPPPSSPSSLSACPSPDHVTSCSTTITMVE